MDDKRIVIDASVALKWFQSEEQTDAARELLNKIEERTVTAYVPDLILYEMANAWIRGMKKSAGELEEILAILLHLPWIISPPSAELLLDAARFAKEHAGVSVYDATYIVLAMHENASVITADRKLQTKLDQNLVKLL